MGRPSNSTERRSQIISAFIKVMAKRGYEGASVSEIAAKAKLAPGLVHYHFEAKLEILLAALDLIVSEHSQRLDAALADCAGKPAAEVAAFINVHVGTGSHSKPESLACWVLIGAEAMRLKEVKGPFEAALESLAKRLRKVITGGVRDKVFDCEDPRAAAAAILAAIQGYFVVASSARAVIPRGSAAASLVAMANGLLSPTKPIRLPRARA